MAKEQDLPLNSAKISGVCGRLMCCLRYEFEAYKDFKSRAPKKKTLIDTPLGKAKIQEYNTPREQLVLRLESGKVFRVNLSDMTCSEGCKKRAEEQGCSCRPDCVTRDILERIESPDIALALMELDREAGIDVGDGLSRADRLVPAASAVAEAMIAARVRPTSKRRAVAVAVRVPLQVQMARATIVVLHARQPRDRLPRAAVVAIFRARSATTLSAPRQLARRPLPHRRKTALPAAPAVAATRPLLSLGSRPVSVRRASRRCLLWQIRWLRARSRLRAAVLAMAGEPVRQSMVRAPRLPTTRLRAVRASRAEVRTAPLEAPTTLRLPSR